MKLHCAGLLLVRERKLLLAYSRNKKCFYLPGGKIDTEETASQALCREISEELNITITEKDLNYYTHITAPAYGELTGTIMEQDCFFFHQETKPMASAEIEELRFFSLHDYLEQENRAPGAVMVLKKLKADGFID
jgi:8-oxo-dGTP pyrophosphatase MutT (NUDIX family)